MQLLTNDMKLTFIMLYQTGLGEWSSSHCYSPIYSGPLLHERAKILV